MKFTASWKNPELDMDLLQEHFHGKPIDDVGRLWAAEQPKEAEILVEANQRFQKWLATGPTDEDVELGNVPADINDLIVSITKIFAIKCDWEFIGLYPGLEQAPEQTFATNVAISRVYFEKVVDLESPSLDWFPRIKWVDATFDLPIVMSAEEIQREEAGDNWWYIARDVNLMIAGAHYDVYVGNNGSKSFARSQEDPKP